MAVLHFLQELRAPWLDAVMNAVTLVGSEAMFLVAALFIFWCTEKKNGYYLLVVGFLGITVNQFLKILCRIPRPWVRDPSLTVVQGAQEAATGYSFPSGHTQNIAGTAGVVSGCLRQRWGKVLCWVVTVLVGFSRMYLGVHTPADVLTALGSAIVLVLLLRPVSRWAGDNWRRWEAVILVLLGAGLLFLCYVSFWPFPADVDAANLAAARKSAWMLEGAAAAMALCCWIDGTKIRFPTQAVWGAQLLKTVLGLALVLAVKEGLKPVLRAAFGSAVFVDGIRYFCCVIMAGAIWPLSFRFFSRLGRKS